MAALLTILLKIFNAVTPDIWLIIGLFVLAFVFISLERFISKRRKQTDAATDKAKLSQKAEETKTVEQLIEELEHVTKERDAFEKARDYAIKAHENTRQELAKANEETRTHYSRAEMNHGLLEQNRWLVDLAAQDKRDIHHHVLVTHISLNFHYLEKIEPYVELTFTVFSGSLYPVSFNSVEGYLRFDNDKLGGNKELFSSINTFTHGAKANIRITQYLSHNAAATIKKAVEEGRGMFKLDKLLINFSGKDIEPTPLMLPEGVWTTGVLYP